MLVVDVTSGMQVNIWMGEQVVNLVPLWGELFYISPLRVRAIGRRISWNALPQKMFSMQVNQLKSPIGFLTRPPLISEFYMPQPSVSAGNRGTSTIELFGTGFQILLMNEDSIPRKTFTMPTYLILFTVLYQLGTHLAFYRPSLLAWLDLWVT